MSADDTALAWARARSGGPLRTRVDAPVPDGMIRLAEPDGTAAWLVPRVPDTAGTRVLAELGLAGPPLEQPNDTARLLAAALRCCWADPHEPPWPGRTAGSAEVLAVFGDLTGPRDEAAHRRSAVAGLRRLDQAGWLLWDEAAGTVRLGPRVALWSGSDLSILRQLWRAINFPEQKVPAAGAGRDGSGGAGQPVGAGAADPASAEPDAAEPGAAGRAGAELGGAERGPGPGVAARELDAAEPRRCPDTAGPEPATGPEAAGPEAAGPEAAGKDGR